MDLAQKQFSRLRVTLKLAKKGGALYTYISGSKKRFLSKITAGNWEKCFIKVSYGKGLNQFGKVEEFINEGEYKNKNEAILAFRAFTEI